MVLSISIDLTFKGLLHIQKNCLSSSLQMIEFDVMGLSASFLPKGKYFILCLLIYPYLIFYR